MQEAAAGFMIMGRRATARTGDRSSAAVPVHAGPSGAQARRAGVQQLRLQPQQQRRQRQEEEHGGACLLQGTAAQPPWASETR